MKLVVKLAIAAALLIFETSVMAATPNISLPIGLPTDLPILPGEYQARYSLNDRGRTIEWTYTAVSRQLETQYFGQMPTLMIAVHDIVLEVIHYLNSGTGEIVIEKHPTPYGEKDAVTHLIPNDPEYQKALSEMRDQLATMIRLNKQNQDLNRVISYLDQKIILQTSHLTND